jgi:peptide/nickel transport system substrate-binding protein
VLTVAWGIEPKILTVAWVWDNPASAIDQLIFDPLVKVDIGGGIHPGLADSWDISPDGKTYTFHLAKNVKWQDGVPFTSADVKWTLDSIVSQKGPGAGDLTSVDQITTPDDNTVVVQLKVPDPRILEDLYGSNSTGSILPKHLFDGTDLQTNQYNFSPVGTGPFKFVEMVAGDHLTLQANPDYFRGKPAVDKVVLKFVPDPSVAVASLESGEAQFVNPSPAFNQVPQLKQVSGVHVDLVPSADVWWLRFNERPETIAEPLRGPHKMDVRRAVDMAIDKDEINQKVFLGLDKPAQGVWSSISWAFNTSPSALQPQHDPAAAEKLLDDAGYPRGADGTRFQLQLMLIQGWAGGSADAMAQVIQQQLRAIGIDVKLDSIDAATSFSKRQTGNFDMFLADTNLGPDPDQTRSWLKGDGFANWYGSKDPTVDSLYDQGVSTTDKSARTQTYYELQKALAQNLTMVSLIESQSAYAYRDDFANWFFQQDSLSTFPDFSKLTPQT